MFSGIGFDLDGTLCDFESAERAARTAVCGRVADAGGLSAGMVMQVYRSAVAATIAHWNWATQLGRHFRRECWRRALAELGLSGRLDPDELGQEQERLRLSGLKLYPDARPLLDELAQRYPLALITNGAADMQRRNIDSVGVGAYFRIILAEGELGFGKPDRRVFDMAREALGCAPHQLLFIGDNPEKDVVGAQQAGWRAAWLNRRRRERPPGLRPDYELTTLEELRPVLEGSTA